MLMVTPAGTGIFRSVISARCMNIDKGYPTDGRELHSLAKQAWVDGEPINAAIDASLAVYHYVRSHSRVRLNAMYGTTSGSGAEYSRCN